MNSVNSYSIIPSEIDQAELNYALLICLQRWGCPANVRQLILIIQIYSRGELIKIVDGKLCKLVGCSKSSVSKKRKALDKWQRYEKATIIKVDEHSFNWQTKKNEPTQYKFLIADLISQIVRTARESIKYASDWEKAIDEAAELLTKRAKAEGTLKVPAWRYRKPRRDRNADAITDTLWKMFCTIADKNLEHARRQGKDTASMAESLASEVLARQQKMILKTKGGKGT